MNNHIDQKNLIESTMETKENISNNEECDLYVVEPALIPINYHFLSEEKMLKEEINEISQNDDYFKNYPTLNEEVIEVIIKSEPTEENIGDEVEEENSHVSYNSSSSRVNMHCLNNTKGPIIKQNTLPLKRLNEQLLRENMKKQSHICNVCDKYYPSEILLKAHLNSHPGVRPYKCDICLKQFNFKNNLARHMLLHGGGNSKSFPCNICDKVFSRKDHLTKHKISHTEGIPYECIICNKLFKYKDSLRNHMNYHNGEKRFCCTICGNGFIRRDNLHVHLRTIHANEKQPIECPCKGDLSEKCSYEERKKVKIERKFYNCKSCDTVCTTKNHLKIHSYIHLKDKPYKCNICNSSYSQKGTLADHIRIHTGEKPFICFLCDGRFRLKCSLRIHLKRHRNKRGVFVKFEPTEEANHEEGNALEND